MKKHILFSFVLILILGLFFNTSVNFANAAKGTLSVGSTGADVKVLQQNLINLGFLSGWADGKFGPRTFNAVKEFQREEGISVDGRVGPTTSKEIAAAVAPTSTCLLDKSQGLPFSPSCSSSRASLGASNDNGTVPTITITDPISGATTNTVNKGSSYAINWSGVCPNSWGTYGVFLTGGGLGETFYKTSSLYCVNNSSNSFNWTVPNVAAVSPGDNYQIQFLEYSDFGGNAVPVDGIPFAQSASISIGSAGSATSVLIVTKSGTGSGTVTSTPGGINCGTICNVAYNGNNVYLAATPSTGSVFTKWTGDCSATGKVTMDGNKTCNAVFDLDTSVSTLSIFPTSGPIGTTITITGTNLGNSGTINFGTNSSLSKIYTSTTAGAPSGGDVNERSINYLVTGGTVGASYPVSVTSVGVTTNAGTFTVTSAPVPRPRDQALSIDTSYLPPATVGVSYLQQVSAGTVAVPYSWSVLSGSLPPGLVFNGSVCTTGPCPVLSVVSGLPTTAGTYTFTVKVVSGTQSATKALSIYVNPATVVTPATAPVLSSVSPTSGLAGSSFAIKGSNLSSAAAIHFGSYDISASCSQPGPGGGYAFNDTSDNCMVPSGITAGTYQVYASSPVGNSASIPFTVSGGTTVAVPTVTSLSQTSGTVGSTFTINGTNIPTNGYITLGGMVSYTGSNGTSITNLTVPNVAPGSYPVSIYNGTGSLLSSYSNSIPFNVITTPTQPATPTITSLSPSSGPVGTPFTINGTNLPSPTSISGSRVLFSSFLTYSSGTATSIPFVVPAVTAGTYRVAVYFPDGSTNSLDFIVTATAGGSAGTTSCQYGNPDSSQLQECPTGYCFWPVAGPGGGGLGADWQCKNASGQTLPVQPQPGVVLGTSAFHFTQFLQKGKKGNEVLELQKFLKGTGYDVGTPDGKFGAKTEAAVLKFQTDHKMAKIDGKVGPTMRALLNK